MARATRCSSRLAAAGKGSLGGGERVDAAKEAGRPAVLFKVTDSAGTSRFVAVKLQ